MTHATRRGYVDPRRPHLAWIRLVCEIPLRNRLIRIAEKEGVSLSEVVRQACREYVEEDGPIKPATQHSAAGGRNLSRRKIEHASSRR